MSYIATCKLDDEKQLYSATEFKIALAVKDGDRQDKQETPDSSDF